MIGAFLAGQADKQRLFGPRGVWRLFGKIVPG